MNTVIDNNVLIYINNKAIKATVSILRRDDRFSFQSENHEQMYVAIHDAYLTKDGYGVVVKKP